MVRNIRSGNDQLKNTDYEFCVEGAESDVDWRPIFEAFQNFFERYDMRVMQGG